MKIDHIQRIALSGLLLALVIIFTRFLSIQNIPLIPFVRISLGPALIIFASLLLGPLYGGVVGGLSDILGIVLVPNAAGYSINPWFTLVYTLLGVLPWCIYKLIGFIKNEKILYISTISFLGALFIFVTVFLLTNNTIILFSKEYSFELYQKIIIIASTFLLGSLTSIGLIFINRYFVKKNSENIYKISTYKVAFTSMVSELLILLILNSIVKMLFFETDFLVIFFSQSIVFFINIILDTFIATLLLHQSSKIFKNKESMSHEEEK